MRQQTRGAINANKNIHAFMAVSTLQQLDG